MKNFSKLLACVMVFAIVLSTVVMPVSAAGNLAEGKTVTYNGETKSAVDGVYSFTGASSYQNAQLANVALTSGKTYYFAYEVKLGSSKGIPETWKPDGIGVSGPAAGSASASSTLTANQWYKFEFIGTATSTGNFRMRIRLASGCGTIEFRNFQIYEQAALTVNTDVQEIMPVKPVITYTFSNPLKADLAASNFDRDVTVSKTSSMTYTVAMTGLEYDTPYSLTMSGVEDVFGQTLADDTISFTTSGNTDNILMQKSYDYSFENGDTPATEGTITATVVSRDTGMPAAKAGSKYVKATDIEGDGGIRFNNIEDIKIGRTYEFWYYARTVLDENLTAPEGNASVFFSSDDNSVYFENVDQSEFAINGSNWTKVKGKVTVNSTDENLETTSINVGTKVSGVSEAYFDLFEIVEVIPEFTITTNPENGASDVRTDVMTFVFSNPLETDLEAGDISISLGSVSSCEKISETEYKVTFTDTEYGRLHTVSFNRSITDIYEQTIDDFTTKFTKGAQPTVSGVNLVAGQTSLVYEGNAATGYNDGIWTVDGETLNASGKKYVRFLSIRDKFKSGQTYRLEVDAKYAEPAAEGVSRTGGLTIHISGEAGNGGYNKQVISGGNITDEWQTFVLQGTVITTGQDDGYKPRTHIGVELPNNGHDVLLRNFVVVEDPQPMTVTTTPASGAEELEKDTEILVNFGTQPYNFDENSFVIEDEDGNAVTSGISCEKVSNKSYKIILEGLNINTQYTLTFGDIMDVFGQSLVADPVVFKTTMASNLIEDNFDFSFEGGQTAFLEKTGAQTFEVVDASDVPTDAPDGEKILKISGREANATALIKGIGSGTENSVKPKRKYLVSFYIRTADTENGVATTDTASVYVAPVSGSTVVPASTATPATAIDRNWKQLSYIVDTVADAEGTENKGLDIGIKVAGTSTVYVDELVFKEYIPEINTVTDPVDGETAATVDTVTYTFTTEPVGFTTDKVSITGGTAAVADVTKISDMVYKVNFSNIENLTEYTVTLSGVVDVHGRDLSKTITFTTYSGNPEASKNILTGSNNGFENSVLGVYAGHSGGGYGDGAKNGAEIYTVVGEENGITPYEGSKMLKIEANGDTNLTSFRLNSISAVEIGKQYQISYYARTVNQGDSVTGLMYHSPASPANNTIAYKQVSAITGKVTNNKWTKISLVVEIMENTPTETTNLRNRGFHVGVNISGVDVYIDDFQLIEIPTEELHITSTTPATGETNVSLGTEQVVINFSEPVAGDLDLDSVIKVYKGNEDVTDDVVTAINPKFDYSAIIISLNTANLEGGTTYKVVATNVKDYLGRTVTGEVAFTTISTVSTSGSTMLDVNGDPLVNVTADAVKGAKINVVNTSIANIPTPLYIYTVYDAEGHLVKSGTTSFADTLLAPGENIDLPLDFDGTDLNNKILTLYLVNSYESLQLAAEPVVFNFIPQP